MLKRSMRKLQNMRHAKPAPDAPDGGLEGDGAYPVAVSGRDSHDYGKALPAHVNADPFSPEPLPPPSGGASKRGLMSSPFHSPWHKREEAATPSKVGLMRSLQNRFGAARTASPSVPPPMPGPPMHEEAALPELDAACCAGLERTWAFMQQRGDLAEEGIYRVPGDKSELDAIAAVIARGADAAAEAFDKKLPSSLASGVKLLLREHQPIVPYAAFGRWTSDDLTPELAAHLFQELSPLRQRLLHALLLHMLVILERQNAETNRMSAKALATCIGVNVFRKSESPADMIFSVGDARSAFEQLLQPDICDAILSLRDTPLGGAGATTLHSGLAIAEETAPFVGTPPPPTTPPPLAASVDPLATSGDQKTGSAYSIRDDEKDEDAKMVEARSQASAESSPYTPRSRAPLAPQDVPLPPPPPPGEPLSPGEISSPERMMLMATQKDSTSPATANASASASAQAKDAQSGAADRFSSVSLTSPRYGGARRSRSLPEAMLDGTQPTLYDRFIGYLISRPVVDSSHRRKPSRHSSLGSLQSLEKALGTSVGSLSPSTGRRVRRMPSPGIQARISTMFGPKSKELPQQQDASDIFEARETMSPSLRSRTSSRSRRSAVSEGDRTSIKSFESGHLDEEYRFIDERSTEINATMEEDVAPLQGVPGGMSPPPPLSAVSRVGGTPGGSSLGSTPPTKAKRKRNSVPEQISDLNKEFEVARERLVSGGSSMTDIASMAAVDFASTSSAGDHHPMVPPFKEDQAQDSFSRMGMKQHRSSFAPPKGKLLGHEIAEGKAAR